MTREEASRRLHHQEDELPQEYREMGVVPESPLAKLLAKLSRPDRRMLLAAVTSPPGPRRRKLERQVHRRLRDLGFE